MFAGRAMQSTNYSPNGTVFESTGDVQADIVSSCVCHFNAEPQHHALP